MSEKETTLFLRRFPEKLKRKLKAEAARQGKNMIDLVIEYIKAGLEAKKR
jgi:plasmid stability protein